MGCLALIFVVLGGLFFGIVTPVSVSQMPIEPVETVILTDPTPTSIYDSIPQARTDDGAFILGNPDAPVTIVMFEDFLCPHCQSYQPTVKQFIQEYVATGQAKLEFRMLTAVHPNFSPFAFQLAECAATNGESFWEAHDVIFELASLSQFNDTTGREFADRIGISYETLLECTSNVDQYVNDAQYAQQFDWVTGTPAVGWRLNDGELRKSPLSGRPTADELGALVESQSQQL